MKGKCKNCSMEITVNIDTPTNRGMKRLGWVCPRCAVLNSIDLTTVHERPASFRKRAIAKGGA